MSGSGISWAICKFALRSGQITMPATHRSVFIGQMPFPLPNQQRQSTESLLLNIREQRYSCISGFSALLCRHMFFSNAVNNQNSILCSLLYSYHWSVAVNRESDPAGFLSTLWLWWRTGGTSTNPKHSEKTYKINLPTTPSHFRLGLTLQMSRSKY